MELEVSLGPGTGTTELPIDLLSQSAGNVDAKDPLCPIYPTVLSLDLLFKEVERLIESGDSGIRFLGEELLRRVAKFPELRGPITHLGMLDEHPEVMELLMLFIIPPTMREKALYKFSRPFNFNPIYLSPAMQQLVSATDACYSFTGGMAEVVSRHYTVVGAFILRELYGVDIEVMPTTMLTVPNAATGLVDFYKPDMMDDYLTVVVNGEKPALTQQDINRLLKNVSDTALWQELLPIEKFEIHGLHIAWLHEVTAEEALSRIKHHLISRDAILNVDRIKELAEIVRIHFKNPSLRLGLAAVDYPTDRSIDHEYRIRFNLLAEHQPKLTGENFVGSIYERAFRARNTLVIEDLTLIEQPTHLEKCLLTDGIRSILIAPLLDQDGNVVGLVELGCPEPYGLNNFMELKFREIRDLFRTAIERSREYIDNRLEAVMREQYTSLHSSVEWKFTAAAYDILQQQEQGKTPVSPAIEFKNVYPLYAQADIVGSSGIRNAAIYQDLFDNLRSGRFFLARALELVSFPLIQQVLQSIDATLVTPVEEFDNSHEIRFTELIHHQITPLVHELQRQHPELRELADRYLSKLHPELGLFARIRSDYESSVHRINQELSDFFTERDLIAQATLPHYFEKYKTDGVEYEIYAGQSICRGQTFSDIHLRNLRLAQLIDVVEASRLVDRVCEELPMPLRTAQLIFVYSTPLDIKFRMDEKRFDVEGDYNIRYEILKKRIDKATIYGGEERLTLADHVSIVYLQDADREEYLGYLNYLRQSGYLDGTYEELVLDPLQSVNGLRALRFKVKL